MKPCTLTHSVLTYVFTKSPQITSPTHFIAKRHLLIGFRNGHKQYSLCGIKGSFIAYIIQLNVDVQRIKEHWLL